VQRLLFRNYDVPDTSYTYGYLSDPINATKYLITSGSSTTVSELNSGDNVFQGFGTGWTLEVNVDGTWTVRTITSVSGAPDSVTVNSAVNWQNGTAGRAFSFRQFISGQTASDGWFSVSEFRDKAIQIYVTTLNFATSINATIEGRIKAGDSLKATTIWSKSYTASATTDIIEIAETVDEIRLGFKGVGTDNGVSSVSAYFKGVSRYRQ